MTFFSPKREIMQVCNRCGGLLQSTSPRDVFDGGVYHLWCGWKVRRLKAEKEAVRDIAPPLINLGVNYVPRTIVGNPDPT